MTWKQLFSEYREKSGIVPKTKDDYYKIMSEAAKSLNADSRLKEILLLFLKPYSYNEYNSEQSYKWASIVAPTFLAWLSERKKRQITLQDLDVPNITPEDVGLFADEYSPSAFVQAHLRSHLIKFFNFLASRYYINKYPLGDMTTDMPISNRTIVYNDHALDEFLNVILFGAKPYVILFFKLLLQTGLRPKHAMYMTCGIVVTKPQKDALGRIFYPIAIKNHIAKEKRKIKEEIAKKFPPEFIFISESLKNEILKWCQDNKLKDDSYIFKDFINLDVMGTFIERRRKSPKIKERLKQKPEQYMLYGLRHTWSSVVFGVTKNVGDLIDLGGWRGQGIPLTVYRQSMSSLDALNIVKKWEIYIPPDRKPEIDLLQGLVTRGEPEPKPQPSGVDQTALDNIMRLLNKLENQLAEKDKRIEQLEKKANIQQ